MNTPPSIRRYFSNGQYYYMATKSDHGTGRTQTLLPVLGPHKYLRVASQGEEKSEVPIATHQPTQSLDDVLRMSGPRGPIAATPRLTSAPVGGQIPIIQSSKRGIPCVDVPNDRRSKRPKKGHGGLFD